MRKAIVILLTVFAMGATATSAGAHVYSYNSGYSDAYWSVVKHCGGGTYPFGFICNQRWAPYIWVCGAHSWCWSWAGQNANFQEVRYLPYKVCNRRADGRAEHGRVIWDAQRTFWCS